MSIEHSKKELFKDRILSAYAEGSSIMLIAESYDMSNSEVKEVLQNYRQSCRTPRTFTDEFKKMVAERDMNGAARMEIARELGINVNTVKKACEELGQKNKDRTDFDRLYTKIEGIFTKDKCYKCESTKLNDVDDIGTTYCFKCGSEVTYKEDHILVLNWEFVD
jgi:transposase-like protein